MINPKHLGIKCPKCGGYDNKVSSTKDKGNFIMRIRKCLDCGHRWDTVERIAETYKEYQKGED